jgi:hypothetical protein
VSAVSVWQLVNLNRVGHVNGDNRQLGNPVTPSHGIGLCPEVDQDDLHLASVPGVDETRTVCKCDPVAASKARTRKHKSRKTRCHGNRKARGRDCALPRREVDILDTHEVETRVCRVGARRKLGIRP